VGASLFLRREGEGRAEILFGSGLAELLPTNHIKNNRIRNVGKAVEDRFGLTRVKVRKTDCSNVSGKR